MRRPNSLNLSPSEDRRWSWLSALEVRDGGVLPAGECSGATRELDIEEPAEAFDKGGAGCRVPARGGPVSVEDFTGSVYLLFS